MFWHFARDSSSQSTPSRLQDIWTCPASLLESASSTGRWRLCSTGDLEHDYHYYLYYPSKYCYDHPDTDRDTAPAPSWRPRQQQPRPPPGRQWWRWQNSGPPEPRQPPEPRRLPPQRIGLKSGMVWCTGCACAFSNIVSTSPKLIFKNS